MKKLLLILALLVMVSLFVSCIDLPDEPNEYAPWCKEEYKKLLADDPNYPRAFIGACISTLKTGQPNAFAALCRYEPFRDSLENGPYTHQECVQYIRSLKE